MGPDNDQIGKNSCGDSTAVSLWVCVCFFVVVVVYLLVSVAVFIGKQLGVVNEF